MQYIKHVSNNEAKKAYMDCEGIFRLHFNHSPNEDKIQKGENIALYQKLGESKTRVFTHLVVIVDKEVYGSNEGEFSRYIYVQLIAKEMKGFPLDKMENWTNIKTGGYSSGKLVNIDNILQVKNDSSLKGILTKEVWDSFFPNLEKNYSLIRKGILNAKQV